METRNERGRGWNGWRAGRAWTLAAALAVPAVAWADDGPGGGLVVHSEPNGALVVMDGEIHLEGVAPLEIDRGLEGRYRVSAELPGYESWSREIQLSGTRSDTLRVHLTQRTRTRAAVRGLFVPGWGQRYAGRSRQGSYFFLTTAALGVVAAYQESRYRGAVDDYQSERDRYLRADDADEARAAFARMEGAYDDVRDHRHRRNAFAYAGVAVWGVAFLDVVVSFPSPGAGAFTLAAYAGAGGPGVALARGF